MSISEKEIEKLITCTQMFMNHVHWVQHSFNLIPERGHYGTCINYVDRQEYRDEFCRELINTIPEWVYSQKKAAQVLDSLLADGRSQLNAQATLTTLTFEKFRSRDDRTLFIQGQFGELLLFNFLQSFFKCVPLLRKMPITTSLEMERFGADAIHYKYEKNKNYFFLGEAKTYTKAYGFNSAINDAIQSILKTYRDHRKELGMYIYDSFIDDSLIEIAKNYKNGILKNVEVHLVSVITYCENKKLNKENEDQIKSDIINIISERCGRIDKKNFKDIEEGLYPRFNYIIFPVWELDELLIKFQKHIGK